MLNHKMFLCEVSFDELLLSVVLQHKIKNARPSTSPMMLLNFIMSHTLGKLKRMPWKMSGYNSEAGILLMETSIQLVEKFSNFKTNVFYII